MTMFIADPEWDERDFDRLEEFISELALPNPGFRVLTPLPGTTLYDEHAHRFWRAAGARPGPAEAARCVMSDTSDTLQGGRRGPPVL